MRRDMNIVQNMAHPILRFLNRLFGYPPGGRNSEENDEEDQPPGATGSNVQTPDSVLEEDEKRMIHGVVELGETEVQEIMRPRQDMVCAEENSTLQQMKELAKKYGHSRFPIYKKDIDNVTGIIHVKDLFLLSADQRENVKLSSLARKAYFVPDSKRVDELLREFKRDKIHMAIVVDEYGGTAGLVTLEDVLEEIVGEIQDEYDKEVPPIRKLDVNTYRVEAKVSLEELNEALGTRIEEKGFETVGGFIYDLVGSVPEQGRVLEYACNTCRLRLQVERVEGQRIRTVKITVVSPSPKQTDSDQTPSKNLS
jgi:putative hemolysin